MFGGNYGCEQGRDFSRLVIFTEKYTLKLENYREAFLNYLGEHLVKREPEKLYDPVNYIMSLGGKRMRPVLVLMGCDVFGGDVNESMEAALSVEMFHNFTLIHDDIMDSADLRRGKETVHIRWDLNTGILSGDALMIMSSQRLEHYDGEVFKDLISLFNRTALEVCEGQQLDINFENMTLVPMNDYLKMISYKTAVLVAASLKMGAIIAGATAEDQDGIYNFGLNLGIAFQLQDDYLDTYGDKDFGKKIGGDILEGKKTYLYIKALELCDKNSRSSLLNLYAGTDPEKNRITEVKAIFDECGAPALLLSEIEKYTAKAMEDVDALSISGSRKQLLKDFALSLMNRKT